MAASRGSTNSNESAESSFAVLVTVAISLSRLVYGQVIVPSFRANDTVLKVAEPVTSPFVLF